MPLPTQSTLVVGLPFSDTFDNAGGWSPSGVWEFDPESEFGSGAWYLAGTQRETVSTLEYQLLIDLSGTLPAQLIFRQKGYLPISDLIAIDLSFDGGLSWSMIEQQIGIDSDWDQHLVDLQAYRGQVVRLRLRVSTGIEFDNNDPEKEIGYWVDNLTIQYMSPPPEFVEAPVLPGTLMGLHMNLGADPAAVLDLVRRLREAGYAMGTIKGTTGTEDTLNQVAAISPETVIVYRSLMTPWGQIDCPDPNKTPEVEARVWMAGISSFWNDVNADYYEIMNECVFIEGQYARSFPMEWIIPFSIEAMRFANEQGRCLLLFSFGGGTPEVYEFAQLLPVFEYALDHPCQPGRYHGIALHSYSGSPNELVSESDDWLGYRHRRFFAAIVPQLPEVVNLPVYITEAGPGNGYTQFSCADITRDIIQYTDRLKTDPYIKGFHLWTLGWSALDITACLPLFGDALIDYYSKQYPLTSTTDQP